MEGKQPTFGEQHIGTIPFDSSNNSLSRDDSSSSLSSTGIARPETPYSSPCCSGIVVVVVVAMGVVTVSNDITCTLPDSSTCCSDIPCPCVVVCVGDGGALRTASIPPPIIPAAALSIIKSTPIAIHPVGGGPATMNESSSNRERERETYTQTCNNDSSSISILG